MALGDTVEAKFTGVDRKFTRKGEQMATFTLEDLAGSIEVTVFPRLFATQGHLVVDDQIVVRPMMYLALSYDHRLIDGREAVGFLKLVKELYSAEETQRRRRLFRQRLRTSPNFGRNGAREERLLAT